MESSLASQSLQQQNNNQQLIYYNNCPVCSSINLSKALSAKDFTVSHQSFEIWQCNDCSLRFTQNIPDANNIGTYYQSSAYVSHSDTNEGLINRLYHIVRNFTLQSKKRLIEKNCSVQNKNLLDVGAGIGAFSNAMKNAGWNVTALEPDDAAREKALQKFSLQMQLPETIYQLEKNKFNAITMWHVLEHVHELHKYLETFHRILNDDGKLFIAVPNYTSYDAQLYKEFWAAYDVPRHLYHFSPKSMETLARLKGFTVKAFNPMWFDSFYVSMLSEQYKNGNANNVSAFINGLISNLKTIGNPKNCSSVIYVLEKN